MPFALHEIRSEFAVSSGADVCLWERLENALWQRRQRELHIFLAQRAWHLSTSIGRRQRRAGMRRRYHARKQVAVGVVVCRHCRKFITRSALHTARRNGFHCSRHCAQAASKRHAQVTIEGVSRSIPSWAKHFGIGVFTVYRRIEAGWSVERALTTPAGATRKGKSALLELDGEALTVTQWARRHGLAPLLVVKRLRLGWPLERALTAPVRRVARPRRPETVTPRSYSGGGSKAGGPRACGPGKNL